MAKISNKDKYPKQDPVNSKSYFVVTHPLTGETEHVELEQLVIEGANILQNNTIRDFQGQFAIDETIEQAVASLNNSSFLQVSDSELINLVVPRLQTITTSTGTSQLFVQDYYWLKSGKGTYGINGTITIDSSNLLFRGRSTDISIDTIGNLPPVVYDVWYESIFENTIEDFVNASETSFFIDSNADYIFSVREIAYDLQGFPYFTFNREYYRFIGDNGTYGLGFPPTNSDDYVKLDSTDTTADNGTLLALSDVFDNSYDNIIGMSPVVVVDALNPNIKGVKFQNIVAPTDIYRANTTIGSGIAYLGNTGGLVYRVRSPRAIINQKDYTFSLDEIITLNDGDATFSRIDLIVYRLDSESAPISGATIAVIEGTPTATPVEPSINQLTEAIITRRVVLANEVTDPNITEDVIYDDNNEWTNIDVSSGINLADTTSFYVGPVSINVPEIPANSFSKNITWDRGSLATYTRENSIVFAMENNSFVARNSVFTFELINSVNGSKFIKTVSLIGLALNGFSYNLLGWQVVDIPFSELISDNSNNTQYDTFKLTLKDTHEYNFDWFRIQGGVPVVSNPPLATFDTLPDTPNSKVGQGLKLLRIAEDEEDIEYIDDDFFRTPEGTPIGGNIISYVYDSDEDVYLWKNHKNWSQGGWTNLSYFIIGKFGPTITPPSSFGVITAVRDANPITQIRMSKLNAANEDLSFYFDRMSRDDLLKIIHTDTIGDYITLKITSITFVDAANDYYDIICEKVDGDWDGGGATTSNPILTCLWKEVDLNSLKTTKVSLTAAQINNIGTTSIDAIPASGVGTYIKVLDFDYKFTWGSVAFDLNPISIKTDGASLAQGSISGQNIDSTSDIFQSGDISNESVSFFTKYIENTKVVISGTDSVAVGDSAIDLYITYMIIEL